MANKKSTGAPLWLLIRNIDSAYLQQLMYRRFAPTGASAVNWKEVGEMDADHRASALVGYLEKLQKDNLAEFSNLYGALTIVGIAGASKSIHKWMDTQVKEHKVVKGLYATDIFLSEFSHERLEHPIHRAAWFAIKEKLQPLWEELVGLANNEQTLRMHWVYFPLTDHTKEPDEQGLNEFENSLRDKMAKIKPYEFPVTAHPYPKTGQSMRFVVSTPKDPILCRQVERGHIMVGLDNNANNFFIDWFFDTDTLRVTYPDVTTEEDIATLFSEHVLGNEIKKDEKRYFNKALSFYTSSKRSAERLELSESDKDQIASLRINSIDFTYAQSKEEADARDRLYGRDGNKAKRKKSDPFFTGELHPAFKCHKYEGQNIWSYIDQHFPPDKYPPEWRTILSIQFSISLYDHRIVNGNLTTDRDKTHKFSITVKPTSISYSPKWHEIHDAQHRETLKYLTDTKLQLIGHTLSEYMSDGGKDAMPTDVSVPTAPEKQDDTLL